MASLRTALPLLICLLATESLLSGAQAAAPLRRCTGAGGVSVYTDKPCDLLQAQPRLRTGTGSHSPPPRTSNPVAGRATLGAYSGWQCPRRLSELVDEIQQAIQGADINRLSAVYWWGGMGNAQASSLLERLETMVSRPLVDIAPVYPPPPSYTPAPLPGWVEEPVNSRPDGGTLTDSRPTGAGTTTGRTEASVAGSGPSDSQNAGWPQPSARPRPHALRIEQILGNSGTPSREVLYLRRQYGCFWVSF